MRALSSHVGGRWVEASGELETLVNPATEEPLARAGAARVDRRAALEVLGWPDWEQVADRVDQAEKMAAMAKMQSKKK